MRPRIDLSRCKCAPRVFGSGAPPVRLDEPCGGWNRAGYVSGDGDLAAQCQKRQRGLRLGRVSGDPLAPWRSMPPGQINDEDEELKGRAPGLGRGKLRARTVTQRGPSLRALYESPPPPACWWRKGGRLGRKYDPKKRGPRFRSVNTFLLEALLWRFAPSRVVVTAAPLSHFPRPPPRHSLNHPPSSRRFPQLS